MKSLKEWATVIGALKDGRQTVILRKGGIRDAASGFVLESEKFLLFPTYEHQMPASIKKEFHPYLDAVRDRPAGVIRMDSYAQVLAHADVSSQEKIDALDSFHIWSADYVRSRMDWHPERSLKAVFLRVFGIKAIEVPMTPEHAGCKSWIDINAEIPPGQSALGDSEIQKLLQRFGELAS